MNRQTEQRLLAFCATQHGRFNPGAWTEFQRSNPDELACAAQTLSRARWYGHLNDLQAFVAEQLRPQQAAVECPLTRKGNASSERLWRYGTPPIFFPLFPCF